MKKICLSLLIIILVAATPAPADPPSFYQRHIYLGTSPGVFGDGLVGFANPAQIGLLNAAEYRFYWSTDGNKAASLENWGLIGARPPLGLAVMHYGPGNRSVTDCQISLGLGTYHDGFGLAYRWSTGGDDPSGRENSLKAGFITRPSRYLSVGLAGSVSMESRWSEVFGEIGLRPLGNPYLTVFADRAWPRGLSLKDAPWSVGAAVQAVDGISLTGRYFDDESFTLGLTVNLGSGGIGGQAHFDNNQKAAGYSYMLRSGIRQPDIFTGLWEKESSYLPLSFKGRIDYNKYMFFDAGTRRLSELLMNIRAAVNDIRIAAIAVNLSGMRVYPEHAWELRRELLRARDEGKKVIIFFDNAGLTRYHLASVADIVVMDPEGIIRIPGLVMGSTFFKGTLAKLGIGFDEWRFFKYKSAAESLSRESMSAAEAEQTQAYIDDWYELIRAEVCRERNLTPAAFDRLVDDSAYMRAEVALRNGLVDTLARWSDRDRIITQETGRRLKPLSENQLLDNVRPPRNWGPRPRIAIVYGLGACAVDYGINARRLEQVFLALARDRSVKAVVFRIDSPGGDGLASDMVAQALRRCAENKPVVVSQGQVAASGGYWLSMYADTILTGPTTLTGSIGVIAGWVYDNGFSEKVGFTSDFVKRGKHADLWFGLSIPLTGLRLPVRNVTPEERREVEKIVNQYYDSFVTKVAEARGLSEQRVREIGEGRVYSGLDAREIGLVDEIGGLMPAVSMARHMAGLQPQQEVDILEIPMWKGWLDLREKLSPLPVEMQSSFAAQLLYLFGRCPGCPMPLVLPGMYPEPE